MKYAHMLCDFKDAIAELEDLQNGDLIQATLKIWDSNIMDEHTKHL